MAADRTLRLSRFNHSVQAARLVDQLNADDYDTRQKTVKQLMEIPAQQLMEIGGPVLAAVEKATNVEVGLLNVTLGTLE